VTNNTTNFPNATAGNKATGTAITFPSPSADWGTVVGFGFADASTSGNLLAVFPLDTPKTIANGTSAPSIAAGSATITLD
jgi:hypothetical protein